MNLTRKVVDGVRWRADAARNEFRRWKQPKPIKSVWTRIRSESLSYTSDAQLDQLVREVRRTAHSNALIVEAGCARGGSAILMCAAKAPDRPLKVYDMFEMIPPPSDHDGADMKARYQEIASGQATGIDGGTYYLYENDLKAVVENNFKRYGYPIQNHSVELIKGDVTKTLKISQPVALAHVDVDWYEPVRVALGQVVPNLIPGGSVALHAYFDWSGCRKAADEFFERHGHEGFKFDSSAGHLLVTRRH